MDSILPDNYKEFLDDYEKLCRKHKLMVLSEGEKVTIGDYERLLWNIRLNTIRDLRLRKKYSK